MDVDLRRTDFGDQYTINSGMQMTQKIQRGSDRFHNNRIQRINHLDQHPLTDNYQDNYYGHPDKYDEGPDCENYCTYADPEEVSNKINS